MAHTNYDDILNMNNSMLIFSWDAYDSIIQGITPWMHHKPYPFISNSYVEYPMVPCPSPLMLNYKQLLVVPNTDITDSLYIYNVFDGEWSQYLRYPSNVFCEYSSKFHTTALNSKKSALYIWNGIAQIIKVDLITKIWSLGPKCNGDEWEISDAKAIGAESLFIENKFHVFGGGNHYMSKHFIYNEDQFSIQSTCKFDFIIRRTFALQRHCIVHVESNKSVLIFIGNNHDEIFEYSLMSNTHKLLATRLTAPMMDPKCVVSINKALIIIFGTDTEGKMLINVLDLQTMKIYGSNLSMPIQWTRQQRIQPVIIHDEDMNRLCVSGYLHQTTTQLPKDVVELITKWFQHEIIHVFTEFMHWSINLDEILNSL